MVDCWFFHVPRFATISELIDLSYDLAWYWKTNPEQVKAWPLDVLFESEENAWRIQELAGANNGG